jgi:hypothetical protein
MWVRLFAAASLPAPIPARHPIRIPKHQGLWVSEQPVFLWRKDRGWTLPHRWSGSEGNFFVFFSLRFLTEMHTFLEPKKLLDRSLPELPRVDLYGPRSEPISDPVGPVPYWYRYAVAVVTRLD